MKLHALQDALRDGPSLGALIHEKTGIALRADVLAVEEARVLAVTRDDGKDVALFGRAARVRLELPRETSVILVPGRVAQTRRSDGVVELEIDCTEGAEDRQRRMDVRVSAHCRVRVRDSRSWLATYTVNLSAGGALLADGDPTHPGDSVDVELDLAGETIRCRGEKTGGVSSRTNAAIRFLDLPAGQRERIAVHVLSVQAREKATKHPGPGPRVHGPREDDGFGELA